MLNRPGCHLTTVLPVFTGPRNPDIGEAMNSAAPICPGLPYSYRELCSAQYALSKNGKDSYRDW